jgi:protein TonB
MKTESEQVQRWDDIIFEKRNKEYGAYAIRKNYDNNVLKAEAISIGVGILIFVIPILMSKEQVIIPIIEDQKGEIVLKKFDIKVDDPPRSQETRRRVDASIIPIKPTIQDTPDEPVDPQKQDVTFTSGPDTGTQTTDTGTDVTFGSGSSTDAVAESPKVFIVVEIMPSYEGGYQAMMKFIQKKMRYPSIAVRKKDEGTVYVSFVIAPDGSVTDVEVVKGISKECDQEAVRVISMMNKWKPGIQNNQPVSVRTTLPITFRLE